MMLENDIRLTAIFDERQRHHITHLTLPLSFPFMLMQCPQNSIMAGRHVRRTSFAPNRTFSLFFFRFSLHATKRQNERARAQSATAATTTTTLSTRAPTLNVCADQKKNIFSFRFSVQCRSVVCAVSLHYPIILCY